jgi:hypothetical protein
MNEQIWKLAEQIVCFEQDMDGSMEPNEDGQWIRVDELEKFAELIVKECAELCEGEAIFAGSNGRKDASASNCSTIIRKHFGVEE